MDKLIGNSTVGCIKVNNSDLLVLLKKKKHGSLVSINEAGVSSFKNRKKKTQIAITTISKSFLADESCTLLISIPGYHLVGIEWDELYEIS